MTAADQLCVIAAAWGGFTLVLTLGVALCAWVGKRVSDREMRRVLEPWRVPNFEK